MPAPSDRRVQKAMQSILDAMYDARDKKDQAISGIFEDLPDRKHFPDYYDLVKRPMSLNIIQENIKKNLYSGFTEFVQDCSQIAYNAKLYNRRNSLIYQHACILEDTFRKDIDDLMKAGTIGDIEVPMKTESNPGSPGGGSDNGDDKSEDDDVSDGAKSEYDPEDVPVSGVGTGGKVKTGGVGASQKALETEDDKKKRYRPDLMDLKRRRGRPPKVDTPNEAKIKVVLRGLRKEKSKDGRILFQPFERLPDVKQYPDYYRDIKDPISLDQVKKRLKRREYKNLDSFQADMDLMFTNAQKFNTEGSEIYKDSVVLQKLCHRNIEIERQKDDSEYITGPSSVDMQDSQTPGRMLKMSRLPLESIEHKGEVYRVGDWVHIVNPNDNTKPIIAQVFRTWKTTEGQKWINVCWYYRPEQTVHRADKSFFENEVFKTGQYRDHQIEEVVEKCFVMFLSRYTRGRPKNVGNITSIYVCENRYNEENKYFNKIKSWKSCVPDEVRGTDYEMFLFERQQFPLRVPSPLIPLLPAGAKEGDPPTEMQRGKENAPPTVGSIIPCPIPDPSTLNQAQAEPSPPPCTPAPAPVQPAMKFPPAHLQMQHGGGMQFGQQAAVARAASNPQTYQPAIPPCAFILPQNLGMSEEESKWFLRDEQGRVLWFSTPPVDPVGPASRILGHSLEYLAAKKEIEEKKKRKAREEADLGERKVKREIGRDEAMLFLVKALGVMSGNQGGYRQE
ncbi:Chromatin structure-remodeling complex subunit rsc1 [Neolecta irregularis DAH-3]|uniref:Chromatin structure-remodeling complex subunit rsc1 n=1 Tax=Neolecta irregularis (strain DAH-3) TaxID=1198029 RepID=A0A1U7LMS9_NEOID|nr:Chromatin structure-remodeling complex subunit rsc1 [Neolecta irregularis DAH-3]|eukprot:OLL23831.1 Chromatin structure-remodeling complex subunit rsc1 [Neolecta irregularis DAH-3]